VGNGDRGVDVDDQSHGRVGAGTGGPRPFPRSGTYLPQPGQVSIIDAVEHSPSGSVAGDRTEQFVLIAQGRQVSQSVTAVGDHHRQIRQNPPGLVDRQATVGVHHRRSPASTETSFHGQLPQQRDPGT